MTVATRRRSGSAWRAVLGVGVLFHGLARATAAAEVPDADTSRYPADDSATEINRQLTNPVPPTTWSLKIENDVLFLDREGASDRVQYELKFQPTMPVVLSPQWKLITRPQFVLIDDKPYTKAGVSRRTTGVGDTTMDVVLGPMHEHWLAAIGPTFIFPTASSEHTGQGNWQMGPIGVAGYTSKQWLAGLIAQQWWSFAGPASRKPDSELHLQYLASWFFSDGWSVGTSPTIEFDWRATPGNQVTFPLGLFAAKVVKFGGRIPVKFEVEGLYAPVRPDSYGEEFAIKLFIIPVVPAFIQGPLWR